MTQLVYRIGGETVIKPRGLGGPGIGYRCRLGGERIGLWLWWAAPHENGGRRDYFHDQGWALSRGRAIQHAFERLMERGLL